MSASYSAPVEEDFDARMKQDDADWSTANPKAKEGDDEDSGGVAGFLSKKWAETDDTLKNDDSAGGSKEWSGSHDLESGESSKDPDSERGKVDLLAGWAPSLGFSKGQQSAKVGLPGSIKVPPPNGLPKLSFSVNIPIPGAPPGLFFVIKAGIVPAVNLGPGELELLRKVNTADARGGDEITFSGSYGVEAKVEAQLDVGVKVGVPKLLSISAGGRAKAAASAKLTAKAGGTLDRRPNKPEGTIFFHLMGDGVLEAALAAFIGYEVLFFEGDLYEIEFKATKVKFAEAKIGAGLETKIADGKSAFNVKPLIDGDYATFDWMLLSSSVRATKLDKAKAQATEVGGDLAAMKEIRETLGPAADMVLKSHKEAGIALAIPGGKFQILENEKKGLQSELDQLIEQLGGVRADRSQLERIEAAFVSQSKSSGKSLNKTLKGKRRKEAKELAKKEKQLSSRKAKLDKRLAQIGPEQEVAQAKFLAYLTGDSLDKRMARAEDKFVAMNKTNMPLFTEELRKHDDAHNKKMWDLHAKIEAQTATLTELQSRSPAVIGAHESKLRALHDEIDVKYARVKAMVGDGDIPSIEDAFQNHKIDLAAAISAWESTYARAAKLQSEIPVGATEAELLAAQAELDYLQRRWWALQEKAIEARREERALLLNEKAWAPR